MPGSRQRLSSLIRNQQDVFIRLNVSRTIGCFVWCYALGNFFAKKYYMVFTVPEK